MTKSFSLPTGCLLRPACAADKPGIRKLLQQFRQEVVPPVTLGDWILRAAIVGCGGLLTGYLAIALGLSSLLNLLAGFAAVVGIGALLTLIITWNEDWENFWIIEQGSTILACAKLRRQNRYSLLHDLYVLPEWRSQGLGSYLVHQVSTQATKPLYLTCLPKLVQFYLQFGFTPVSVHTLSPLLQYELGIPGRFEVVPLVLR
jgi:N-acetylglutamate synthase-like GNAT family acetyltransferase